MTDKQPLDALLEGTTPGPWFVEEMDTRKRQYRVRCTLGQANGGAGIEVVKGVELDHDARLIAAAPQLACDNIAQSELIDKLRRENDTLRAALARVRSFSAGSPQRDNINAVIDTALGRTDQ